MIIKATNKALTFSCTPHANKIMVTKASSMVLTFFHALSAKTILAARRNNKAATSANKVNSEENIGVRASYNGCANAHEEYTKENVGVRANHNRCADAQEGHTKENVEDRANYKALTLYIIALPLIFFATSCSTTRSIPEGEVLYTGIGNVNYVDQGDADKNGEKNKGGVIVAIADAAEKVQSVLSGKSAGDQSISGDQDNEKQMRKANKQARIDEQKALEAAQEELDAVLAYAPNNSFFGSSYYRTPLPIGLWAYNAWGKAEKGFGRWLYNRIGSEPVLISSVNPETRAKVAGNVLKNYGFFRNRVDYDIAYNKHNERKAKVNYYVHTDKVYRIDSVEYLGFTPYVDSLIKATHKQSYLQKNAPFSAIALSNERTRIANMLRNRGYYYFQPSATSFKADTVAIPYRVQLQMLRAKSLPPMVMKQWHIGRMNLLVLSSSGDTVISTKPLPTGLYSYTGSKVPIRPEAIMRNVLHRSGRLYRYRDQERTQELLNELGVFSQLSLKYSPQDTTQVCDSLDLLVSAVMDTRYNADFEINVTEKNAERIGPGLSLGIKKKNALKGAELLSFRLFGSYEWKTNLEKNQSSSLFNSYEVGTEISLNLPRMVLPGMSPSKLRFPASTSIALNADWLNRSGYYNLFSFGTSMTYSWHRRRTSKHTLTPISLTYYKLLNSTAEFDSIMDVRPSLAVSMQDRLVPAIEYTYAYTQTKRHRNPLTLQFSVKEAGAFTSGIYAIAGQKFSDKNKKLFNNPFAQFIKLSAELHNDFKLTQDTRLVTRVMGGIAYAYGNSDAVPYSDQFYSGGANSIRAFTIRSIGPGRFKRQGSKYSYMDQTGDIKMEANMELRFRIFGALYGATFLDAGNVWLLNPDDKRQGGTLRLRDFGTDIALGTGAGIRYNMDFLVVRLDLGFALHDPAHTNGGYFSTGRLTDRFALHFAIGYPF